jgi:hypothetical protein
MGMCLLVTGYIGQKGSTVLCKQGVSGSNSLSILASAQLAPSTPAPSTTAPALRYSPDGL